LQLVAVGASNDAEIVSVFLTLWQRRIRALIVTADGYLISRQDQLVTLADRYAVPTMYSLCQYAEAARKTALMDSQVDGILHLGRSGWVGLPDFPAVTAENSASFTKLGRAVQIEPSLRPPSPENGYFKELPETFPDFGP
jgi:hypothetical protein